MPNAYSDQVDAGDIHGWHVYVLAEEGDEYCKIGSALTVKYRIDGLKNGNPRKLAVVADYHCQTRDAARAVEARALAMATAHRLPRRDWLKVSHLAAIGFVERAIADLGIYVKRIEK